jgi:cell division protein FtsB
VLASLVVVVVIFAIGYAVLPTRSWLAQRDEIAMREQRLEEIDAANATLEERVKALESPAEIERIARRDLGLVMPGEEPYVVLPPAPEPIRLPEAWPFTALADALDD